MDRLLSIALIAGILAIAGVVSCAPSPPPTPTAVPTPTAIPTPTPEPLPPSEVVANAATAMAQLSSFRFKLTHPSGSTVLQNGLIVDNAEGAVVAPDQLLVEADAELASIFVGVEAVLIGDRHFMTNPLSGEWAELSPDDSPFAFLDINGLIANILGLVRESEFPSPPGPGEDIIIEAVVRSYALAPLVGDVVEGLDLDLVLIFDPDSFVLKSARISGRLQEGDEDTAVRLVELKDFNTDIEIVPPIR